MAEGKPIKFNELADLEPGIREATNAIKAFETEVTRSLQNLAIQAELFKKALGSNKVGSSGFNEAAQGADQLKASFLGLKNAQKVVVSGFADGKKKLIDLRKEQKKLSLSTDEGKRKFDSIQREIVQTSTALQALTAETKRSAKSAQAANNSYDKMSIELTQLRRELKRTDNAFDSNTGKINKNNKEAVRLEKRINKLDGTLKKFDKNIGQNFRNVGNYQDALKGAVGGLKSFAIQAGIGIGVAAALAKGFQASIQIFRDFGLVMSKVKAVTGATDEEFIKLESDAKRLGATTIFTASQVGELQLNFAKIGFSTSEILSATEATLALAAATDTDLASAAEVAGSTVRAFQLDASETGRVTDVMAASFTSSALDIENFRESMKLVAPIAKAANIPIETTTALLGKLADSGLKGSIAGTGLKNVLSKLTNPTSKLSKELGFTVKNSDDLFKAFKQLKKGNIDLAKATELTDERSKAAFLTLVNGVESAEDLTRALEDSAGSAAAMAEIVGDNLEGDIKRLASAFEGLILEGGAVNNVFRDIVTGITSFIGAVSGANKSHTDLGRASLETSRRLHQEAGAARELVKRYEELTKEGLEPTADEKAELASITLKLKDLLGSTAVEIDKETKALRLNLDATKDLLAQKVLLGNEAATEVLQQIENNKALIDQQKVLREDKDGPLILARQLAAGTALKKALEAGGFSADLFTRRIDAAEKGLDLFDVSGKQAGRTYERLSRFILRNSDASDKAREDYKRLNIALVRINETTDISNRLTKDNIGLRKDLEKFLTPSQVKSLLGEVVALNKAEKEGNENTEDGNDLKKEEIKNIASLKAKLSELRKEKEQISIFDKNDIANKQRSIDKIRDEIEALEKLGKKKKEEEEEEIKKSTVTDLDLEKLDSARDFSSEIEQIERDRLDVIRGLGELGDEATIEQIEKRNREILQINEVFDSQVLAKNLENKKRDLKLLAQTDLSTIELAQDRAKAELDLEISTLLLKKEISDIELQIEQDKQRDITSAAQEGIESRRKAREEELESIKKIANSPIVKGLQEGFEELTKKRLAEEKKAASSIEDAEARQAALDQIAKKEFNRKLTLASIDAFTSEIQRSGDVSKATKAASNTFIAGQIVKAIAGFKHGGYTGDGGVNEVAGLTHGQEFVVDANTTKELGLKGKSMADFDRMLNKGDFAPNLEDVYGDASRMLLTSQVNVMDSGLSDKDADKIGKSIAKHTPDISPLIADLDGHLHRVITKGNTKERHIYIKPKSPLR